MRDTFNRKADPDTAAAKSKGQLQDGFSRAVHHDPNADIKALIAEKKRDLLHAQPSLHPNGAQGPNHRDWEQMREREDKLHTHAKEQHQVSKLRHDFDMNI
ncbi:MAG: hypothetical protein ACPGNV_05215 [Mangrovicoccus sp.]